MLQQNPAYQIYPCGDHAITLSLGEEISPSIHRRLMAVYSRLLASQKEELLDIIPAYTTLTLVYNLAAMQKKYPGQPVFEKWKAVLQSAVEENSSEPHAEKHFIRVPVCYDPSMAPDIAGLAAIQGISVADVVSLHTAVTYRVYMIGFLPGFAYMGSVDAQLATPRKAIPRKSVPAGSVGIAGEQTGIYPLTSPGGWQLIGRTPCKVFDAAAENPCLFKPGDEVNFYAITSQEFHQYKNP